jgi:AraC family cel operon transcriptional repressor
MRPEQFRVADILEAMGVRSAPYVASALVIRTRSGGRLRRVDYVEFVFVAEGRGRRIRETAAGELTHTLAAGDLFVFRPGDDHALVADPPDVLSLLVVSIPAPRWNAFAGFAGIDPRLVDRPEPPDVRTDPSDPRIAEAFRRAIARFDQGATGLDLAGFFADVLPLAFPGVAQPDPQTPEWLVTALEAMADEQNLRRGVHRLAELAHVSRQHLASTTRRHLGQTPTSIVQAARLRHAAALLATTTIPIGDVARRCGFATLAHFSASFSRAYGMSPRDHRATAGPPVGPGYPAQVDDGVDEDRGVRG